MTAVAVLYRPAMDSCKVGIRLCRLGALTAPDFSDPGEYPEGWRRNILIVIVDRKYCKCEVSMKELQYNFGVANVLVL